MTDHHHDWQTDEHQPAYPVRYTCTTCAETTQGCQDCAWPLATSLTICDRCLNHAKQLVTDTLTLYRQLPDTIAHIAGLHAIRYDRDKTTSTADTRIIGGAALVLSARGNHDKTRLGRTETTIDPALLEAERNDPPSVWAVITFWEDAFRQHKGDQGAPTNNLTRSARYLVTHTLWAAQNHPDWDNYLHDLRALRAKLRIVTGQTSPPRMSDAPCIMCKGTIVQTWKDDGLSDDRECNQCGRTFTPEQYMLAVMQQLRAVRHDDDRLLTATEARTLWRLSEKQIYTWEARGKLAHTSTDTRGRRLYRNGDIAALRATPRAGTTPV